MSEMLPVIEDLGGQQPMDENVDPAPQVRAEVEPPANAEKPLSRRQIIAQSFGQKEAERTAADGDAPAPVAGRARDQLGRFAGREGTIAAQDAGFDPAASVQLPSRKPMPRAWRQDLAPKWDAMDNETANFLADHEAQREQQVMAGVDKYRGLAQYAEGLRDVIAPREQALVQHYGSIQGGLDHLFQLSDAASQNPAGFIQWFAQQRGIDLRSLMPAQAGQASQQQDPNAPQGQMPDFAPMIQQAIQPFAQRTMAVERQMQQYQQERQQQESNQRTDAVNTFFSEADVDGTVKFLLPDDQMDAFAKRVKFLRAENPDWDSRKVLEKSYDELTWTSESLRTKRLESDARRQAAELKDRQAKGLTAKKAAAVSVRGAPGTSPSAQIDPRDRRALIARGMADFQR